MATLPSNPSLFTASSKFRRIYSVAFHQLNILTNVIQYSGEEISSLRELKTHGAAARDR